MRISAGHAARISALAYSSTSNFIVSVSANMAILQWECKIFTKVSGKARVEDEYDPCEDEIQKLFSEFQKEIKRAPAIDGVKDYTDAVHKLDEAFELIRLSVVAQDWDQKFLGLANGMIKSVLEQLENLSKDISERLDRGEISRVGFPVERYLERIKSVAMLFASLTRFSSDLQSGVEDIKKMKAKADQFEASMRQVLIKLNEGFRLITQAEAHLSTLGGHLENVAKDLDTPKPPTPTILARILQSCKRCREEEGEVQKNLTEARKITLKGFRDEFVKTIDVAARMLDDAMLELKVVETLHNLSSGQQQADQDAQLRALRDLEKLIGLLKENNHTGKLVKRHAHTMMKQAKKPQTQHSGGDHYSDDEHDVDDESPPHVQAGRPRVAPPDDSDGAGAKARGAPKPTEDSMEEEGVEDWEPGRVPQKPKKTLTQL